MMEYLGGLPYIDKVITTDEASALKRLSYVELAEKVAEDFKKAADLLPVDWDNTATGRRTAGKNELRINKICALSYLGKTISGLLLPLCNMALRPVRSLQDVLISIVQSLPRRLPRHWVRL